MATLQGIARTNYFRVVNKDAFLESMNRFDLEVVEEPINGIPHFALFDTNNGGTWPIDVEGMGGKLVPIQFMEHVAEYLPDDEVAVFMGISYEGTRSIAGHAVAVNNNGKRIKIELEDIYALIKTKWGRDVERVQF